MDKRTNEKQDITVPELKELLSEIYDICESNINSVEFYDALLDKLKDKVWLPQLVQQFGVQIREVVSAIRDYNKGRFRNANVNDIAFATSLLLYYTEPTGILPKAKQALNPETEMWVTQILISQSSNLLKNYKKHIIDTNGLMGDILGSNLKVPYQDIKTGHNGLWNTDLGTDEDTLTDVPKRSTEGVREEEGRHSRPISKSTHGSRHEEGNRYREERKDSVGDGDLYNGSWDRDSDMEYSNEEEPTTVKPVDEVSETDEMAEEYVGEECASGDNLTYN